MRALLATLAALGLLAGAPAAAPAAAGDIFETLTVPTVGGAQIHVEIARPAGSPRAPVILTYSPYNTIRTGTRPNLANDALYRSFGPRGYARAVADVIGTRNSTGCWDYGGANEQQSGVDVVNALAAQPWSNGRVGMIGGSYDGTTATMVAAAGERVPGLAAIVPQSAISRWYGYAYSGGVRHAGNTQEPTDEGIDTPLAFDFGFGRTPPDDPSAAGALAARASLCEADQHTLQAYSTRPDYGAFWLGRDYLKDAASFRVPALVVHGWQDYNVWQREGIDLFEALPVDDPATAAVEGVPFKKLYMFQGPHASPSGTEFKPLLAKFFDRTLLGVDSGVEALPAVLSQTRDDRAGGAFLASPTWPPPGAADRRLSLARSGGGGALADAPATGEVGRFTDSGLVSEEAALAAPEAEQGWQWYTSAPVATDTRIAGTPRLRVTLTAGADHGHLTPVLVDVAPDGGRTVISRGFLDLRYRGGLERAVPVPVGTPVTATVRLAPQDHTLRAGHRLGLLVSGSDAAWAISDAPGATITLLGGSELLLPVA